MTTFRVLRDDLTKYEGSPRFDGPIRLNTGASRFKNYFGEPTTLESDLLTIGAATLAADRACKRGEREDFSNRRIDLTIPVVNIGRLQPLAATLEQILRELSRDDWRITFVQARGTPTASQPLAEPAGRTLLFSGGLDSLAAALEFDAAGSPLLVSHVTHNRSTATAQEKLVALLRRQRRVKVPHYQFFVSSRGPGHSVEESQRSRSFLFLVLGGLVATRTGHTELVYLAENGQMAIHLPLSQARIGAFSTRTAHPDVLPLVEHFLQQALAYGVKILNPYSYHTKAEVVRVVRERLPRAIPVAVSCWRTTYLPHGATHCGSCIPCYVRRIALEFEGADPTRYAADPWRERAEALPPEDDGRRNLADLAEFILRTERYSNDEMFSEWPELYSRNIDPARAIAMYKRFAAEARAVLGRYTAGALLT